MNFDHDLIFEGTSSLKFEISKKFIFSPTKVTTAQNLKIRLFKTNFCLNEDLKILITTSKSVALELVLCLELSNGKTIMLAQEQGTTLSSLNPFFPLEAFLFKNYFFCLVLTPRFRKYLKRLSSMDNL